MLSKRIVNAIRRLPEDAAPFLSFNAAMKKVSEVYAISGNHLNKSVYIGSDGAGNPIVLNLKNSKICLLDHEDNFSPCRMNETIEELLKSLKAYETHADNIQQKYGVNAYIEYNYPLVEIARLKSRLGRINIKSVARNIFWGKTLKNDRANLEFAMQ